MIYRVPQYTPATHNKNIFSEVEQDSLESDSVSDQSTTKPQFHGDDTTEGKKLGSHIFNTLENEPIGEIVIQAETYFPGFTNAVGHPQPCYYGFCPQQNILSPSFFGWNNQTPPNNNQISQNQNPNIMNRRQSLLSYNEINKSNDDQEEKEEERMTYGYKQFQAARQRFEHAGIDNQLQVKQENNYFTKVPGILKNNFIPAVNSEWQNEALMAVTRQNSLFREGCGCGPGSGCGALPPEPFTRTAAEMADVEAIQQYLVGEEAGPGGIKKIFNFPMGSEPGDLTLLRAAVAANQPKDSFVPEEAEDVEEQIERHLQLQCGDMKQQNVTTAGHPQMSPANLASANYGMQQMLPQSKAPALNNPMRRTKSISELNNKTKDPATQPNSTALSNLMLNGLNYNNYSGGQSQMVKAQTYRPKVTREFSTVMQNYSQFCDPMINNPGRFYSGTCGMNCNRCFCKSTWFPQNAFTYTTFDADTFGNFNPENSNHNSCQRTKSMKKSPKFM